MLKNPFDRFKLCVHGSGEPGYSSGSTDPDPGYSGGGGDGGGSDPTPTPGTGTGMPASWWDAKTAEYDPSGSSSPGGFDYVTPANPYPVGSAESAAYINAVYNANQSGVQPSYIDPVAAQQAQTIAILQAAGLATKPIQSAYSATGWISAITGGPVAAPSGAPKQDPVTRGDAQYQTIYDKTTGTYLSNLNNPTTAAMYGLTAPAAGGDSTKTYSVVNPYDPLYQPGRYSKFQKENPEAAYLAAPIGGSAYEMAMRAETTKTFLDPYVQRKAVERGYRGGNFGLLAGMTSEEAAIQTSKYTSSTVAGGKMVTDESGRTRFEADPNRMRLLPDAQIYYGAPDSTQVKIPGSQTWLDTIIGDVVTTVKRPGGVYDIQIAGGGRDSAQSGTISTKPMSTVIRNWGWEHDPKGGINLEESVKNYEEVLATPHEEKYHVGAALSGGIGGQKHIPGLVLTTNQDPRVADRAITDKEVASREQYAKANTAESPLLFTGTLPTTGVTLGGVAQYSMLYPKGSGSLANLMSTDGTPNVELVDRGYETGNVLTDRHVGFVRTEPTTLMVRPEPVTRYTNPFEATTTDTVKIGGIKEVPNPLFIEGVSDPRNVARTILTREPDTTIKGGEKYFPAITNDPKYGLAYGSTVSQQTEAQKRAGREKDVLYNINVKERVADKTRELESATQRWDDIQGWTVVPNLDPYAGKVKPNVGGVSGGGDLLPRTGLQKDSPFAGGAVASTKKVAYRTAGGSAFVKGTPITEGITTAVEGIVAAVRTPIDWNAGKNVGGSAFAAPLATSAKQDVVETPTIPRGSGFGVIAADANVKPDYSTPQSIESGMTMGVIATPFVSEGKVTTTAQPLQAVAKPGEFDSSRGILAGFLPNIQEDKLKAYATANRGKPIYQVGYEMLAGAIEYDQSVLAGALSQVTGGLSQYVIPAKTYVTQPAAPETKTTTISGGNETISKMGMWLDTEYTNIEKERAVLSPDDAIGAAAFNTKISDYNTVREKYIAMDKQNPTIETTTTTPATPEVSKNQWELYVEGTGRVARAAVGVDMGYLNAREQIVKNEPGWQGVYDRLQYGAEKYMLTEPANLAPTAIQMAAIVYGGGVIGAGTKAVAMGTSRVAPVAAAAVSPTGQTLVKVGVGTFFATGYGIGVTEKFTATPEQTQINIGSTLPALATMWGAAGGANWITNTRVVNAATPSGSTLKGVSIYDQFFGGGRTVMGDRYVAVGNVNTGASVFTFGRGSVRSTTQPPVQEPLGIGWGTPSTPRAPTDVIRGKPTGEVVSVGDRYIATKSPTSFSLSEKFPPVPEGYTRIGHVTTATPELLRSVSERGLKVNPDSVSLVHTSVDLTGQSPLYAWNIPGATTRTWLNAAKTTYTTQNANNMFDDYRRYGEDILFFDVKPSAYDITTKGKEPFYAGEYIGRTTRDELRTGLTTKPSTEQALSYVQERYPNQKSIWSDYLTETQMIGRRGSKPYVYKSRVGGTTVSKTTTTTATNDYMGGYGKFLSGGSDAGLGGVGGSGGGTGAISRSRTTPVSKPTTTVETKITTQPVSRARSVYKFEGRAKSASESIPAVQAKPYDKTLYDAKYLEQSEAGVIPEVTAIAAAPTTFMAGVGSQGKQVSGAGTTPSGISMPSSEVAPAGMSRSHSNTMGGIMMKPSATSLSKQASASEPIGRYVSKPGQLGITQPTARTTGLTQPTNAVRPTALTTPVSSALTTPLPTVKSFVKVTPEPQPPTRYIRETPVPQKPVQQKPVIPGLPPFGSLPQGSSKTGGPKSRQFSQFAERFNVGRGISQKAFFDGGEKLSLKKRGIIFGKR